MSTKARKIPALPYITSISNNDLIVIEKVANSTSSVTSKVSAQAFVDYLIVSPLGFSNVAGNIIPASNNTYDIGSNTKYWNDLYVGNTIYLDGQSLTIDSNGTLVVNGSSITPDRLTSNGYSLILGSDGIVTIPGTISSNNGITLTTNRGSVEFGANLEYPGVPTHYHINKTTDNFDLFLGNDSDYVKLPEGGGVVVGTYGNNYNQWTFGTDGTLIVPSNSTIKSASDDLSLYATGNVNINSKGHNFIFDTDTVGRFIMPPSGVIASSNTGYGLNIFVGDIATEIGKNWQFGANGTTLFPNNTIKSLSNTNINIIGGDSRLWYNIYGELNNYNSNNVVLNGSVTYDSNNNLYVLGSIIDTNNAGGNNLFLKYTPDGQLVWHKTWTNDTGLLCGSFNAGMRFQPGTGGNIDTILFTSVDSNAESYIGTIDLDGNLVDLTGTARTPKKISNFRINDIIPFQANDNAFIVGRYYDTGNSSYFPTVAIVSVNDSIEPIVFAYHPTDLNINSNYNYLKAVDVVSNTDIGTIIYSVGSYNDTYLNGAVLCSILVNEAGLTPGVFKIGNNHEENIRFEDSCSDAASNIYALLNSDYNGGHTVVASTNLFAGTSTINRWQKKISISGSSVTGTSVAYYNNYVYVLTQIAANSGDITLLKLDATTGALQWARNVGSAYYEDFSSSDGGYSSTDLSIDSTGTYITFTAYTENVNSSAQFPVNLTVQYTLDGSLLGTVGNFVFSDSTSSFVIEDHDFNVIDITSTTTITNPVLTIADASFLATTVTVDSGWANFNQPLNAYDSTWQFNANSTLSLPGPLQFSIGTILQEAASVEVIVADLILSSTVDFSTGDGDNLVIGDYGLSHGIAHPWIVYEFTTSPSPVLQLDDVISGVGIPVGSTVIYVGTDAYSTIVITNVAQPEIQVAQPGITVAVVRPIINASLSLATAANTNIGLVAGSNGFIVNHSSIIPFETNVYDLGSPLRRFKTLWLGGSSIYITDETLGIDQKLTARDGNLVVAGSAGLQVGEFTLHDNNILLANTARDINFGSTGATGHINFKRTINVRNSTDEWDLLAVDQAGSVEILSDIATNPTKSALSIVSARTRDVQPPNNLGVLLHLTGSNTAPSRIYHDSFGAGNYSAFIGRHARGNSLTPTQTLTGDIISRVGANPYGTNSFSSISTTRMDFVVREDQTANSQGSEIQFWTTSNGANTINKRVTINEDGLTFPDNSSQSTAFNYNSAVTKISVGTGLTQSANVGEVGIDAIGVLSVAGTANQISVANVGGNYTLSLPQNLNTNATVQFDSITVNTIIVTGSSTIANNLTIADKVIHLAANSTANTQINGGGFTLGNTSSDYFVSMLYDLNNDRWDTDGAGLKTLDLTANTITGNNGSFAGSLHAGTSYLGYDFPDAQIQADANINSYSQIVIKNHSNGTDASADIVATNDIGTDSANYIDMGINSSTYTNPDYNMGGPDDGYLYVNGGDLALATQTSGKVIKFFTGNTTSDSLRLTINDAGLTVVGNISATNITGTLSGVANNSNYLGGVAAANYVSNTGNYTLSGNITFNGTMSANTLLANGSVGSIGQVLTSNSIGGLYWSTEPTGYTGSRGITGYTGSQGNQGIIGYTGSQGAQGTTGYTGSIGYTGSQGTQGSLGYTGSQGTQGTQGSLGYTGSIGYTGSEGIQGNQGIIGYTGSQGNQGTIGYTGSRGTVGFTGSQGSLGYTGSVGYTGSQGTQGSLGYTGSQGTQGSLGYTGSVGLVNTAAQYTWSNTQIFQSNVTFQSEINVHNILANNVAGSNGQVLVANSADGMYWTNLKTHKTKKVKHKNGTYETDLDAGILQDTMTFIDGTGIQMVTDALNETITINALKTVRDAGTTNAVTIDFAVDEIVIYNPTNTSTITLANPSAGKVVKLWIRSTTTKAITHGAQANQSTGASTTFTPVSGAAYTFEYLSTTSANSGVYVNIN